MDEYVKLIFGTRKEANAFKRMQLKGVTYASKLYEAVNEKIPCQIENNVPDLGNYIVDLEAIKATPIEKDGDLFSITLKQGQPKKKGVAVC